MNEPEQQFFAWAGRGLFLVLVGAFGWLWTWMWNRVHKGIPDQFAALHDRLTREYATKEQVAVMEQSLRGALQAQTEQRKEMHEENGKKLDTISEDIRALREQISTEARTANRRFDEHIDRHHSK